MNLTWIDTSNSGVHAHWMIPVTPGHHHHLYIGFTAMLGGLRIRSKEYLEEMGPDGYNNQYCQPLKYLMRLIVYTKKQAHTYHYDLFCQQEVERSHQWITLGIIDCTEDESGRRRNPPTGVQYFAVSQKYVGEPARAYFAPQVDSRLLNLSPWRCMK